MVRIGSWLIAGAREWRTDEPTSTRMSRQKTRGTTPEIALRKALYGLGLRYRVQWRVPGLPRRTIDIAFPGRRVAVFVDGCFWHGCPEHSIVPQRNTQEWTDKIALNVRRDVETTSLLESSGWLVLRFWEHADLDKAAKEVLRAVRAIDSGRA